MPHKLPTVSVLMGAGGNIAVLPGRDGKLLIDQPAEGVVRLTISNPAKRNALDHPILDAISATLGRLGAPDSPARCVVVTGAHDMFSAGYDIGEIPDDEFEELLIAELPTAVRIDATAERYLNDIRSRTTVANLTPDQIHAIGLKDAGVGYLDQLPGQIGFGPVVHLLIFAHRGRRCWRGESWRPNSASMPALTERTSSPPDHPNGSVMAAQMRSISPCSTSVAASPK